MAATLWPPHCPPACSSSVLAFRSARRAFSTSAGTSFCAGSGNNETAGDRTNIASNVKVAIFIVFPLGANLGEQLSTTARGVSYRNTPRRPWLNIRGYTRQARAGFASQAAEDLSREAATGCSPRRKPWVPDGKNAP